MLHCECLFSTLRVRVMNIDKLLKVQLDKGKVADLVKGHDGEEMKRILNVKNSQLCNIRRGEKAPSIDGVLRLMVLHGLKAEDLTSNA